MRPNFEDPLDTAKQLVEKNITLYYLPGGEFFRQFLLESSIPEYKILGETLIIPDNVNHFLNITIHDVMGSGTHAYMAGMLSTYVRNLGRWHRSKKKLSGEHPFGGYLTNKNWHLNEVKYPNNYFVYIFDILFILHLHKA